MGRHTRVERFLALLGEGNLPRKLPQSQSFPVQEQSPEDAVDKLPTVAQVTQSEVFSPAPVTTVQATGSHAPNIATLYGSDRPFTLDSRCGELAPVGIKFSPFAAVVKFPYKWVKSTYSQPVASAIFDAGKIWQRSWDLYYIWSDYYPTSNPVIFVTESQVEALISDINHAVPDAKVSLTQELREKGLVVDFDDQANELRPRWLGRSTSRAEHDSWVAQIPAPESTSAKMSEPRGVEAFKAKMAAAVDLAKNKSKAKRNDHLQRAIVQRQDMTKQILKAQRFLGLRPTLDSPELPATGNTLSATDTSKPVIYPFEEDAIIIAFDVEAWERNSRCITEIGIATLDTHDLKGVAPGRVGEAWQKRIRARHFRIAENAHHVNSDFVAGCPGSFEFGTSEFVGLDKIASVLTTCFHEPFSAGFGLEQMNITSTGTDATAERMPDVESRRAAQRDLILLGHDISQDIQYLHTIGFSVLGRGNIKEALDTASMFRAYTRDPNARSLGSVLAEFDLEGWHLHNAGNDAVYTMWALLAICVQDATERGSKVKEKEREENVKQREEAAVQQARERVADEAQGWGHEPLGDGGVSVKPTEEDFESKRTRAKREVNNGGAPAFGTLRGST